MFFYILMYSELTGEITIAKEFFVKKKTFFAIR